MRRRRVLLAGWLLLLYNTALQEYLLFEEIANPCRESCERVPLRRIGLDRALEAYLSRLGIRVPVLQGVVRIRYRNRLDFKRKGRGSWKHTYPVYFHLLSCLRVCLRCAKAPFITTGARIGDLLGANKEAFKSGANFSALLLVRCQHFFDI